MARVIDTSNMDMVYRDFKRTGRQDFGNVGDLNEFEDADGDTPAQRVMSTWRKWEETGMKDQWIADNIEMCEAENFDAEIAYEYWAAGWRGMAIDALERRRMTEMDNTVRYYVATLEDRDEVVARSKAKGKKEHGLRGWGDIEDMWGEIVESFDTPEEAVDAVRKMGGPTKGVIMKGDLHGPHEYYTPPLERPKMNPAQRALVSNPAWVTKAIAGSYGDLEKKIPPGWLPLLKDPQAVKGNKIAGSLKEYGCGAYGCVLPTLTKEVVLKITTDKTEAEFAAHLAATMSVDVTCHYHKVASLPAKKGGDRIYLLWREEAEKVDQIAKEPYGKKAVDAIRAQHRAAQVVYDLVFYQKGTPADLAKAITAWKSATSAMGKVSQLAFLSRGMLDVFAHQRIFFGDIHEGNVGLCRREGKLEWVITDPGHVTVIDEAAKRSAPAAPSRIVKPAANPAKRFRRNWEPPSRLPEWAKIDDDHARAHELMIAVQGALTLYDSSLTEEMLDSTVFPFLSPRGDALHGWVLGLRGGKYVHSGQRQGRRLTTAAQKRMDVATAADKTSIYVVPWDFDTHTGNWGDRASFDAVSFLLSKVLVELDKNWAPPGMEWWWDQAAAAPALVEDVIPGTGIGVYEFTLGPKPWRWTRARPDVYTKVDFQDYVAQPAAIEAAVRAVSERKNMALIGTANDDIVPLTGMGVPIGHGVRGAGLRLARRVRSIMPGIDWTELPFRAPHYSTSINGMMREIDQAAFGILYLDDVGDWPQAMLREVHERQRAMGERSPMIITFRGQNAQALHEWQAEKLGDNWIRVAVDPWETPRDDQSRGPRSSELLERVYAARGLG